MNKDEALKLALKALKNSQDYKQGRASAVEAVEDIEEALAQPEQEPFEYWNAVEGWVKIDEVREHFDSVGCGTIYKTAGEDRVPLYTTPAQRKLLTDEEIEEIAARTLFPINFARAIEAKLKEKNT